MDDENLIKAVKILKKSRIHKSIGYISMVLYLFTLMFWFSIYSLILLFLIAMVDFKISNLYDRNIIEELTISDKFIEDIIKNS